MGADRGQLKRSLALLYGLNTIGAMAGTALAGFFLIEHLGTRLSLWGTAAVNLVLGVSAIVFARSMGPMPGPAAGGPAQGRPGQCQAPPPPPRHDGSATSPSRCSPSPLSASLLDEIAWTRVLVMVGRGSTYAFTLVLLVFLLESGSVAVSWPAAALPGAPPLADAALAQGITGAGAALILLFFAVLPLYVIVVFGHVEFGAGTRLLLLGLGRGRGRADRRLGWPQLPSWPTSAAPRDAAPRRDVEGRTR